MTYLLTAPDTPETVVSDRFTGDLVDAVGWHVWFDVLAELDAHYPDSYGADICGLLVDLGACCRCGPLGRTDALVRPCPTPARERHLSRLVAAKSLDELEGILKTTSHRSIRLELEAAACNVSAPVASAARATLKRLFGVQAGRCPPCGK